LSKGPQQQLQFEVNLLSEGQSLKCVSTRILNFIERASTRNYNV